MEEHELEYIARLKEAVAIESVSAWADSRPHIVRMMEWTMAWVEKLGGTARLEVLVQPLRRLTLQHGHERSGFRFSRSKALVSGSNGMRLHTLFVLTFVAPGQPGAF